MDWNRAIDLYCERTDPGFWAEPLNALSNVAFLIAAVMVVRAARGSARPWDAAALSALIFLVGIGSFLFHTFATAWARVLDDLFILAFIYVFLALFLVRIAGLRWVEIILGVIVYTLASKAVAASFPPDAFNGSYNYLPPLLALSGLALYAYRRSRPIGARLACAALLFVIALAFRTVDQSACDAWPVGTHFVWHCLNAAVLYLAATSLTANAAAGKRGMGD